MLSDEPPAGDRLTDYDREHARTYLRLLDAEAAGAAWQEVAEKLFKLDPSSEPARIQAMHAAHLKRAKWLRDGGYLQLLPQQAS